MVGTLTQVGFIGVEFNRTGRSGRVSNSAHCVFIFSIGKNQFPRRKAVPAVQDAGGQYLGIQPGGE